MSNTVHPWYAIHVKARQEHFVKEGLNARDIKSILPCYKAVRRWSDRRKEVQEPLFPGYLFASFDYNNRLPVLQTPGLVEIVAFGGVATPVDQAEIDALCSLVESNTQAQRHDYIATGSRVRVTNGPMRGHEGYLVNRKGKYRLVLTVTVLMRAIAVEVDEDDVEEVSPSPKAVSARLTDRDPSGRLDLAPR